MARPWSDFRIEQIVGNLLRIGVIIAAAVVAIGAVVFLVRHGGEPPQYKIFRGEPSNLRHVGGIVTDAFSGHARGLIQLGLLLLIATPVARVVFSIFGFALERDHAYVLITLIVLGVLAFSLAGGRI
jgi:uncharacterized membrane protein